MENDNSKMTDDERNNLVEALHSAIGEADESAACECLWKCIVAFAGCPFYTAKGLCYTYKVRGGEIFIDRKEKSKSITRSSVEMAFTIALELMQEGRTNYGPKKLKVFGASYIWGIFRELRLV